MNDAILSPEKANLISQLNSAHHEYHVILLEELKNTSNEYSWEAKEKLLDLETVIEDLREMLQDLSEEEGEGDV